jgi:hypothetical protein
MNSTQVNLNVPHIRQETYNDCGVACIRMVLRFGKRAIKKNCIFRKTGKIFFDTIKFYFESANWQTSKQHRLENDFEGSEYLPKEVCVLGFSFVFAIMNNRPKSLYQTICLLSAHRSFICCLTI